MDKIFSFKRVWLLLQRYFVEKKKSEIIYWIIILILMMFLNFNAGLLGAFLIIAGAFYAVKATKEIHQNPNNINYLMLPANQIEKFVTFILLAVVYFFIMFIITYIIGNVIGRLAVNFLAGFVPLFNTVPIEFELFSPSNALIIVGGLSINYPDILILKYFLAFLFTQSLFVLGGIYFKKNASAKTILFAFCFLAFLGITVGMISASFLYDTTSSEVEKEFTVDADYLLNRFNGLEITEDNIDDLIANYSAQIDGNLWGEFFLVEDINGNMVAKEITQRHVENILKIQQEKSFAFKSFSIFRKIMDWLFIPFVLLIGYVRLKEKEV